MLRRSLAGFGGRVAFTAFLTFGAVACGGSDDGKPEPEEESYRFGASEVEALVIGSWTGTWTAVSGGPTSRLALEVSRLPVRRAACGSRELGEGSGQQGPSSTPQCITTSEMPLGASLTVEGAFSDLPLTGEVHIPGLELNTAWLSLAGTDQALSAEWMDGGWRACRAQHPDGTLVAECTLERAP